MEKRKAFFQEVANELLLYAQTENATFYAALKKHKEMTKLIKHAEKEHTEVEDYIEKIQRLPIKSEKWFEQFGELKHSVTHHVQEEEGEIFEKAQKILSPDEAKNLPLIWIN